MSTTGKKSLFREMKDWRKNQTENWKLSETHDQIEKQLSRKYKAHSREADRLNKDFGTRVNKATPSVDEYMGRKLQKYGDFKAKERERHDRRYRCICKDNMRNFKQLNIPDRRNMKPEMVRVLYPKLNATDANVTENAGDSKDKPDKTDDIKNKDIEKETELMEKLLVNTGEESDKGGEKDDEEEEDPETPDWYMSRRRFTLAALNDMPEHLIEARRSSAGSANLAAILEVRMSHHSPLKTRKRSTVKEETEHDEDEDKDKDKKVNSDNNDTRDKTEESNVRNEDDVIKESMNEHDNKQGIDDR